MFNEIKNDELKGPYVTYITGGAGKGKTYTAHKMAAEEFDPENILVLTFNDGFAHVRGYIPKDI